MSNAPSAPRHVSPLAFLGLVVVLVLMVAGLAVKRVLRPTEDPSWVRIHADLAVLTAALERYRADRGSFPEDDSLQVLVPGYLPAVPVDPWGRRYIYLNNGKQPLLVTFGHDGERGGSGEEQDHNQYDGHAF
jgi:general secretion pathway protein G